MFDCCLLLKEEVRKKGPCLACWFQQSIESGDASSEEAPPCDPKRKDLTQKEQSKAISMLVAMETKGGLRWGAIMVIIKDLALHVQRNKGTSVGQN